MARPILLLFDNENFREKIALSVVSKKRIKIIDIRNLEKFPGLKNFEVDLLCFVDKFVSGSNVKINERGTILDFFPGQNLVRNVQHNTTSFRSLSYYLEFVIYLVLMTVNRSEIKLNGIRSTCIDISLENMLYVTIPILRKLGLRDIRFKVFTNLYSYSWNTELIIFFPNTQIKKQFKLINPGIINKFRLVNTYSSNNILKREEIEEFLGRFSLPKNFNLKVLNIRVFNKNFNFQTTSLITETTEGCVFGEDTTFLVRKDKISNCNKILHNVICSLFEDVNTGSSVDKKNHIFLFLKILNNGKCNLSSGRLGKLTFLDIKFMRDLKKILGIVFSIKYDIIIKSFIVKLA
nr:RNA 3'phosphate cyclase [Cryptomonas sp.]